MQSRLLILDEVRSLYEGIKIFEEELEQEFESRAYANLILKKRRLWENLDRASPEQIRKVIIKFLTLYRVRNTKRIKPKMLKKKIQNIADCLKRLKNKELLSIDLSGYKEDIINTYNGIDSCPGIGATAVSKILHGINPNLFMIWDDTIRIKYRCRDAPEDYFDFLVHSQKFLRKIPPNERKRLKTTFKRSLPKLLDEFNFVKFTREKEHEGENLIDPFLLVVKE